MRGLKWTNEEINFVRENLNHSSAWIQHYINRSHHSIRVIKLKIKRGLL